MSRNGETVARVARPDMPALTGMRFFAAILVVFLHRWHDFMPSYLGPRSWGGIFSLAYMAVSFFFVLSGFILTKIYFGDQASQPVEKSAFWQARISRIYPGYLASMLLSAPFALIRSDAHSAVYHWFKAGFLTGTNLALLQAWHPVLSGNWNRPTWSVSVEAFFYLIFPIVGAWMVRQREYALRIAAIFWLSSIASSLIGLHFLHDTWGYSAGAEIFLFNPILRLPEFMIGICCGVWVSRKHLLTLQRFVWVAMLLCLLAVPALIRMPRLLVANGLLAPLFGAVIVGLSTADGLALRLLGNRLLVLLGKASFSLYLFHFPVFFWMTFFASRGSWLQRFSGAWPIPGNSLGFFLLYIGLTILVSLLSFTFIETPARLAIKDRLASWGARNRAERDRLTTSGTASAWAGKGESDFSPGFSVEAKASQKG